MEQNGTGGAEREAHLLDYWKVVVRRRWVVYLTTAVITTAATLAAFMQRPVYRATVQLQIEQSTPKFLPFQDVNAAVNEPGADFYQTQYRIIQSRNIARRVIEALDLAHTPQFVGEVAAGASKGAAPGARSAEDDAWIVDLFLGNLMVTPIRNSRLVSVSFDSPAADLAARVANAVADAYITFTLDTGYTKSESASNSMVQQIKDLQDDIARSMRALQEYARDHQLLFVNGQQNSAEQDLGALRAEYGRAQMDRIAKEASYRALKEADPGSVREVAVNPVIAELRSSCANLEKDYAERSDKFKPDWPPMIDLRSRLEAARNQLETEKLRIAGRVVATAEVEYREVVQKEAGLKAALDRMTSQVQGLNLSTITYYSLKTDLESKKKNLETILDREGQTGISARLSDKAMSNIRVVDRAEVPSAPFKPRRKLSILFGLACGLVLGTALGFFLEYMDNSIKTPEDVERHLNLPTLAVVPSMTELHPGRYYGGRRSVPEGPVPPIEMVTQVAPKSHLAEAYRELRTSLLFSSADAPPSRIMITSCQSGEGKTATSINLAVSLTQLGRRVLLVDADLRKPRIHKALGLPGSRGLSNVLSGNAEVADMLVQTSIPGLWLLPSGPIPPNPSELLESARLKEICRLAEPPGGFDHIVFDSPPVLYCADPAILSTRVDAVILIVHGGKVSRDVAVRGRDKLLQGRARLVGVVINNVSLEDQKYYYSRDYYEYRQPVADEVAQQATGAGLKRLK